MEGIRCAVMKFEKLVDSSIGVLTLESDGSAVTALRFGDFTNGGSTCPVLERAAEELAEYFSGKRRSFSIPLSASGTEFQCKVWESLKTIPYGETTSYADIARKIGNPKACRAVGGANNRNPLPIFVPCHRVVGKSGQLVGYAGGLEIKDFLIRLEQR